MNLTINSKSNTWKNPRNRTIVAVSGIALALSAAIGGISSLPSNGSREASVTPSIQGQPTTLFQTSADAIFAAQGAVEITPQFASTVDALDAAIAATFATVNHSQAGASSQHFGLGQQGERSVSVDLAAIAASELMAYGVFDSRPVVTSVTPDNALGLGQPGERSASVDLAAIAASELMAFGVVDAQPVVTSVTPDDALGLGQPGERSASLDLTAIAASELMAFGVVDAQSASVTPQFASMVDAFEASRV